jgi:hypothetical protein
MGFFSSAVFYRPDTPPIVTANELADFLNQLRQTDFAKESELSSVDINWGDQIAENVRPFDVEEDEDNTSQRRPWWKRLFLRRSDKKFTTTVSTIRSLDPDFSYEGEFDGLIEKLKNSNKSIGRLFLSADFSEEQYDWFQAPHPSGEEINFRPDSWSLEFGEVKLHSLSGWDLSNGKTLPEVQAGMMSFSLSGYGYFYPWTFREWIEKFTQAPGLQTVCDLCRNTWPLESQPPSNKLVMLRRECEGLWPYDDIHIPTDWAWGPSET